MEIPSSLSSWQKTSSERLFPAYLKKKKNNLAIFHASDGVSKGNAWVLLKALEQKKKRRAFIFLFSFFLSE